MKINMQSPAGFQLPCYELSLLAPPEPFQHTHTRFQGLFGYIHITRIEIRHCSTWLLTYDLNTAIEINGFADAIVYQVCFFLPPAGKKEVSYPAAGPVSLARELFLAKGESQLLHLPATAGSLLFVHYTPEYFSASGNNTFNELLSFFQPGPAPGTPVVVNPGIHTILQQLIQASPANKLLHLYLQAKVAELLSLLWQLLQPGSKAGALSAREMDLVNKAKDIITADLSVSHSGFSLSKLVGTNGYALNRNFKTGLGISVRQFLHISRMEKATAMLIHSDISITKIAFAVGYKNVPNFSESFKTYYGYPPSHLREPGNFFKKP